MLFRSGILVGAIGLLLLGLAISVGVRADGDEYFIPHSRSLNPDGSRVQDVGGFLGNVRDEAGKAVFDATITVAVTIRIDGEAQSLTYTSYTDTLGHYRTYGPEQVVADLMQIEAKVDPKDVQIVSVEKEGYTEVRRFNRGYLGSKSGPQQVDFVVKRIPGDAPG